MTYWNEIKSSYIDLGNTPGYQYYAGLKDKINSEGYIGDKQESSDVIFLGSCDIMSIMPDTDNVWSRNLHSKQFPQCPYIALASTAAGFPTIVRRLYSYIENFGAPKYVYMTIPRLDTYEYVNTDGICYGVSTRKGTADYSLKHNLINNDDYQAWIKQLESNKMFFNKNNTRYIVEERFSFIETICKLHNINLKWTFNLSDASIVTLYRNIDIFEDISEFMKRSFAGLGTVSDHLSDRSIGPLTHKSILEQFTNTEYTWNFFKLKQKSLINYSWLAGKYGNNIINKEN